MVDQASSDNNVALDLGTWTECGIPDLMVHVEAARTAGQYLFIWDKTGNIDTFFKYKGFLLDLWFQIIQLEHERVSVDGVTEFLRDGFVKAGRNGHHMLIDLQDKAPDFINVYTNPAILPIDVAFNWPEWQKREVYTSVLKQSEDYSADNQDCGAHYYLNDCFTMQIRSTAPDAQTLQEVVSKIPHINAFKRIIIS